MNEEKTKMHESFAAKVILFLILMICLALLYPIGWNILAKACGYPYVEGSGFLRWDAVFASKDGTTLAMSAVVVLFVVTLYLGKMMDSAKKKGLIASGSEYGSARWSTDDEMKAFFYNTTIDSGEKQTRLVHIWRLPKDAADTKI